ncbi:MAG: hypothetical protein Q9181_001688 [Wetmoreana brouardii]
MSFIHQSGSSSPDPLAASHDSSFHTQTKSTRPLPRKALSITTGNPQPQNSYKTSLNLPQRQQTSPSKDLELAHHAGSSPWRIRVTVQAEQENPADTPTVPQLPLKAGDESSPVRRRTKGTPRKPRNASITARPASRKSPTTKNSKASAASSAKEPDHESLPTKRGRGRPRKSLNSPAMTVPGSGTEQELLYQEVAPLSVDGRNKVRDVPALTHPSNFTRVERRSLDLADQQSEFDSVMESEGFSMVSVSSLPSAQCTSGQAADSRLSFGESSPSSAKRQVTPSASYHSPIPPPLQMPESTPQRIRELENPTSGTPRLARVVRAGIALQGVLSPANQRQPSKSPASRISSSSPLSSRDRMDELFNGFGPGTRRELRAGLRLGEELARRQGLDTRSHPQPDQANEDVFAPVHEISYPQLPHPAAGLHYSLKVPDSTRAKYLSFSNTQLPSPARSEVDTDDDQMSWKYDTLPQGVAPVLSDGRSPQTGDHTIDRSSPVGGANMDSMADCYRQQETHCQQEWQAVSKQDQEGNSSQVAVVNSDDESVKSADASEEDDGDIWQEEAHSSGTGQSTSEIPPIFLQSEARKPRRSQLPSPWMRKSQDVLDSNLAPDDSDLFWHPEQAKAVSRESSNGVDNSRQGTEHFSRESTRLDDSSLSISKASDNINVDRATVHEGSPHEKSKTTIPSPVEYLTDDQTAEMQKMPILDEAVANSDLEDSTFQDKENVDSFTGDEDIESTLQSQLSMQNDFTEPLDEGTELELIQSNINTTPTAGPAEETAKPQTPRPVSSLLRSNTPRSKTPKHVRFSTEACRPTAAEASASQPAPFPPAPTSWFSRVTSLLPSWGTSAPAAAVPLPSSRKRIIRISELDQGLLPLYMPWQQCHWWALINIWRQSQANPSIFPFDPKLRAADYLDDVVTIRRWSKKITKQDCAVVQQCVKVFAARGTYKGVEVVTMRRGKKQWGKFPGQWIDVEVFVQAVVAQWAAAVQDGECEVGWGNRAGLKQGSETEVWTKRDLPVDGSRNVYV